MISLSLASRKLRGLIFYGSFERILRVFCESMRAMAMSFPEGTLWQGHAYIASNLWGQSTQRATSSSHQKEEAQDVNATWNVFFKVVGSWPRDVWLPGACYFHEFGCKNYKIWSKVTIISQNIFCKLCFMFEKDLWAGWIISVTMLHYITQIFQ